LFDVSPYRNHGVALPSNSSGYYGPQKVRSMMAYGLEFDGVDDYITIPDDDSLDSTSELTIMGWILSHTLIGDHAIISKYLSSGDQRSYALIQLDNDKIQFRISSNGTSAGAVYLNSNYNHTTYTWTHVAAVFNGTNMNLYINAELDNTVAATGIHSGTSDLYLGKLSSAADYFFNGVIDEVRVYPLALTQPQIQMDMKTQIFQNPRHRWFDYYDNVNGWKDTPTDEIHTFADNDPSLPSIKRNATYSYSALYRYDYIMGFQDFELNAVFEDTTADNGSSALSSFVFSTIFFKDGIWQSDFSLCLFQYDAGVNATAWRATSGYMTRVGGSAGPFQSFIWNCSNTQDITYWPFLIQAWTTEDSEQIAFRISTKWNTTDGVGNYQFSYYYDLVDENNDKVCLDWFDPYIVRTIYLGLTGQDGILRIKSHNWDIIGWVIKTLRSINDFGFERYVEGITRNWPRDSGIRYTVPSGETRVTADPNESVLGIDIGGSLFDPIGFVGTQIRRGITALADVLTEPLNLIGPSIWNSFMGMMQPIIETLTTVAMGLWDFIVTGIDALLYAIFPGLGAAAFSTFLTAIVDFLVGLFSWIANSLTHLVTFLTSTFSFFGETLTKMFNTLSTAVNQWVTMIQHIWGMLEGGYGTGVNIWEMLNISTWIIIFAIFYPILLFGIWETQGIDAVLNHLNMIANILSWIFHILLTVVQGFITVVTAIIESLPGE